MEEWTGLLKHLNSLKKLIAQLLSLDVKMEDKRIHLLPSLPQSYNHFKT